MPSRETAAAIYSFANMFLIVGLVMGAIATVLVVWMGNIKESYLQTDLAAANERAGDAENRAAQANLRLAELTTPRSLSNEAEQRVAQALSRFRGTSYNVSVANDPEALALAQQLRNVLSASGWSQIPYPAAIGFTSPNQPMMGIETSSGITIIVPADRLKELSPAAEMLRDSLRSEGLKLDATGRAGIKGDAIQLHIGTKPVATHN